ncbi:uncharacterized protein LOC128238752 isoform X2 [Mya arenaria]|nr:uncharacterized protein LOC128238752 isoform X2 [Mya arenaria]XP_052810950.1 uncharacterized protein LOC128238752 isoform X2 [Mya arenaria]
MNKRQKSALRSAYRQLADELILDEDFFAALKQNKIFTDGMLGIIKGERTPRDKVYKMLELLEKRGPRAFDKFVAILKENYDWLAAKLEEEFQMRIQSNELQNPVHHVSNPIPPLRSIQYEPQHTAHFFSDNSPRPDTFRQTSVPQGASPRFHGLCPYYVQIPLSAHYQEDNQKRFFQYPNQPHNAFPTHPQTGLDNTDLPGKTAENVEPVCEQETSITEEGKIPKGKSKDACNSPIGVIELPREQRKAEKDGSTAGDEAKDQGFKEVRSQTNGEGSMGLQLEEDTDSENNDKHDGPTNNSQGPNDRSQTKPEDTALGNVKFDDESDDDFPSSEVFYETVRRASSSLSYFTNDIQKAVEERRKYGVQFEMQAYHETDELENTITRSESLFSRNSDNQENLDRMKALYLKLAAANVGSDHIEEDSANFITWDILEDEVDRLIGKLFESDDYKLIKECIELFPEKEKRQPLNICLKNLLEEKENIQEELITKTKEIDKMVEDMWNHQKEMKNIEKLKNLKDTLPKEIKQLKTTNQEITDALNEQRFIVDQRDQKIQELEGKIRQFEEKSAQQSTRRGGFVSSNRRSAMTMSQASRRVPMEPRIAGFTGARKTYNTTKR